MACAGGPLWSDTVKTLVITWRTPADEAAGLARLVGKKIAEGVEPSDVAVACANDILADGFVASLAQKGIRACRVGSDMGATRAGSSAGERAVYEALAHAVRGEMGPDGSPRLARLRGFGLINALGRIDPTKSFERCLGEVAGDEDAVTILGRVQRALEGIGGDVGEKGAVLVCPPEGLARLRPRIVVLRGFVKGGGFGEGEHGEKYLSTCLGAATDELVFSVFRSADEALVRQLGLPLGRRCVVGGRAAFAVSKSPYIELWGDMVPGPVSGEQYLSRA